MFYSQTLENLQDLTEKKPIQIRTFLNPIHRAMELKQKLNADPKLTQADLAREMGVSRARITQILNVLK